MSQTGFPNGGIMPNDTQTLKYSELIKTEEQITAVANDIKKYAYDQKVVWPEYSVTVSDQLEGVITAGLMLGQYFIQQVTYQGNDGYGSENNPVSPPFSNSVNEKFLQSFGPNSSPDQIYTWYNASRSENLGIANLYGKLSLGVNAFSWLPNGNLQIKDNYRFTSVSDFGFARSNLLVSMLGTAIGLFIGTPIAQLNDSPLGRAITEIIHPHQAKDKTYPFYWLEFPYDEHKDPIGLLGSMENMWVNTQWTPQQIYDKNPSLFWDAVRKGYIPLSALLSMDFNCTPLDVGVGPTPFLPNYGSVAADCGDDSNLWTFGGGGNYPKPFTSFPQRIVEGNYSLGPFAKLGKLSGRIVYLGEICPSNYPDNLGFVVQPWSEADIGNPLYALNNELSKDQWFGQANKTKIQVRFAHFPTEPFVEVEVATASFANGNASKYGPDLPIGEDYSLLLGEVILAGVIGAMGGI